MSLARQQSLQLMRPRWLSLAEALCIGKLTPCQRCAGAAESPSSSFAQWRLSRPCMLWW